MQIKEINLQLKEMIHLKVVYQLYIKVLEETTYIQHLKTKQVHYYILLLKTIALLMVIKE